MNWFENPNPNAEGDMEVYADPYSLLTVTPTPCGVAVGIAHRHVVVKLHRKQVIKLS